jgi:hypothetical protein
LNNDRRRYIRSDHQKSFHKALSIVLAPHMNRSPISSVNVSQSPTAVVRDFLLPLWPRRHSALLLILCLSHHLQKTKMIRSNPTAIPLRASDLKHLQATVEQRKAASNGNTNGDGPSNTTSSKQPAAVESSATHAQSGARGASIDQGTGTSTGGQGHNAGEQRRRDRAAMSVNERIGL